jgi:hypothetical protein
MSKDYLEKLKTAVKLQNEFHNSVNTNQINNMNLYQKSSEIQKPIIDKLQTTNEELVKKIEQNNVITPSSNDNQITLIKQPQIFNLEKESNNKSYSLIKTGKIINASLPNIIEFDEWKFKSEAQSNIGRFVLLNRDGIDFIWHYKKMEEAIELTDGLNEILFNGVNNRDIITTEDINNWKFLINSAGLSSVYHNSKLYKKLLNVNGGSIIILPSDPNELKEQLVLQIAAMKAGHKNTFNHANAIMKELMRQENMTSKEYRDILKNIYKV